MVGGAPLLPGDLMPRLALQRPELEHGRCLLVEEHLTVLLPERGRVDGAPDGGVR